jgi:hypothetical protein
MSVLTIAP